MRLHFNIFTNPSDIEFTLYIIIYVGNLSEPPEQHCESFNAKLYIQIIAEALELS